MTKYQIKGTRVKMGKTESFSVTVSILQGELSPMGAMTTARRSMYEDGYYDILFTSIAKKTGQRFVTIPMMEALGLE